jgi:glucose/arabinose dehydrogenase
MKTNRHVSTGRLATVMLSAGLACFGQGHSELPDPIPGTIPPSAITVGLQEVASGFVVPVWGTSAPGDDDHLYVVDAIGKIYVVDISDDRRHTPAAAPRLFLDMTAVMPTLGLFGIGYDERGLLGMAFHPNFRHNGLFYTFTSELVKGKADFSTLPAGVAPNCQSVITEWRVMDADRDRDHDGDRDREDDEGNLTVDLSSARELMRIDKPQFNHNGGAIVFGPDRMLYIPLGDGGAANDQGVGHVSGGNAQSLTAGDVLGKILRIDPLGRNSANGKYGIPHDNPFVENKKGPAEIYAYGFRNPFRISFDSRTGKLWVGDVGQNDIEEIDIVEKGDNYGWPIKEGTFLFDTTATGLGIVYANSPGSPAGLIDPIAEYDHHDGVGTANTRIAINGGFVYRGRDVRDLRGHYIFGDYGHFATPVNGQVFILNGSDRHIESLQLQGQSSLGLAMFGFGEDARGEVYVMGSETGVFKGTTGRVLRITAAK